MKEERQYSDFLNEICQNNVSYAIDVLNEWLDELLEYKCHYLDILAFAKSDYQKLKSFIDGYNTLLESFSEHCNLEKVCDFLGGHNLEEDLFDLNYGCICATVKLNEEENKLELSDSVEVWDEEFMIESNYVMEE